MPACSAPNCRNGYKDCPYPPGVSAHLFPRNNPELLAKWSRALCRENFDPTSTPTAVVCSEHFRPSDYITHSQNSRPDKRKGELSRKRLKPDAVPSIFKIPLHLIRQPPKEWPTERSHAEQRRDLSLKRQKEAEDAALAESRRLDSLPNCDTLVEKLK